jgi:hypothetical protein
VDSTFAAREAPLFFHAHLFTDLDKYAIPIDRSAGKHRNSLLLKPNMNLAATGLLPPFLPTLHDICTLPYLSISHTSQRPYMDHFLSELYPHYDIAIWSQTGWRWLELKVTELGMMTHATYKICFVLDKSNMFKV